MKVRAPHYLLFSEALDEHADATVATAAGETSAAGGGRWHFVVEAVDGTRRLEASDVESNMDRDRLELLAVVRGLEGLDEPAQVTLVTASPYVSRGFRFGLDQWRDDNWQWERFGQMTTIKNADLWQRVDQAMRFHRVNCRVWRFDAAHGAPEPAAASQLSAAAKSTPVPSRTDEHSIVPRPARLRMQRSEQRHRPRLGAWVARLCGRWLAPMGWTGSAVQAT